MTGRRPLRWRSVWPFGSSDLPGWILVVYKGWLLWVECSR